jgi:hypothetical protein
MEKGPIKKRMAQLKKVPPQSLNDDLQNADLLT